MKVEASIIMSQHNFRAKEKPRKCLFTGLFGVPARIRTGGLPLRRRTLYPAELRKLVWIFQHFQRIWRLVTVQLGGERSILLSYGEICARGYFRTHG